MTRTTVPCGGRSGASEADKIGRVLRRLKRRRRASAAAASYRRVTISTCGVVPKIDALAAEHEDGEEPDAEPALGEEPAARQSRER